MKKLLLAIMLASSVAIAGEPKHWLPKPEVKRFDFSNPLPTPPNYINSKGVLVDNSGNLIVVPAANAVAPQVMNSVLGVNVDSTGSVILSSQSAVGGTPCVVTGSSLQYNNAGAFGCVTDFTFSGHTITSAAAGILDVSAGNFKGPAGAGFTATATNTFGLDTTAKNWHLYANAADAIVGVFASAPANGNCIKATVATGNVLLADAGSACGTTTLALSSVTGSAAAATGTETGAGNVYRWTGVETANLTNPFVIENTNSTNNNTSGALVVNAAGTSTGAIGLTVNCVSGTTNHCLSMRSGSTVTTGVVSGGSENAYIQANGAFSGASFTATGTGGSLTISPGAPTLSTGTNVNIADFTGGFTCVSEATLNCAPVNLGSAVNNNGSTGTTANKLAKGTSAPATSTILGTADATSGLMPWGVTVAGAGTTSYPLVRQTGVVGIVTDNATTALDFVAPSTANAGQVIDIGTTEAPGKITVGQVLVTNASTGATNNVLMFPPYRAGHQTITFTADWTCGTGGTQTACAAGTIIGAVGTPMTFTLAKIANNVTLECWGVVGQATAATANTWSILTDTNGATNVTATYDMATAATASAYGAVTDQASTTTAFAISPNWTLGGTGTKMPFHIKAQVEGASASGTVLSPFLTSGSNSDLITIYRGAKCTIDY